MPLVAKMSTKREEGVICRNLDSLNLRKLTVQMDDSQMDHPFGGWSNGPPVRHN